MTLRQKQDNLRYVFILKNPDTFRYTIFYWVFETGTGGETFLYAKNDLLCVTFLSKIYRILLIPKYKRTYDQSNQTKK